MAQFLSDVLTPEDIMQHQRTLLIAGVGAGKNTFFENLGETTGNKVLILTSRKAKVDESQDKEFCKYKTYAHLAVEWINHCKYDEPMMVDDYDILVFDEAHALIIDSVFAIDMVDVIDFLEHYDLSNKKLVFTTATPQPLLQYCHNHSFFALDVTTKCRNLLPQRIIVTTKNDFFKSIMNQENPSFSYFSNTKKGLVNLFPYVKKRYKREVPFYHANKRCTKKDLNEMNDAVFATTVMREGVNINNTNPAIAACESHDPLEIYQFAGRFRGTVDTLYVLYDAYQLQTKINETQEKLIETLVGFENDMSRFTSEEMNRLVGGMIYVSPYTKKTEMNCVKLEAIRRKDRVLEQFDADPISLLREYFGDEVPIDYREQVCLSKNRKYSDTVAKIANQNKTNFKRHVDRVIKKNHYSAYAQNENETIIHKDVALQLLNECTNKYYIYNSNTGLPYKRPGNLFNALGYSLERLDKNSNRERYNYYRVTKQ